MSPGGIDRERARRLMMAALDEEITGEERRLLDEALARDPGLQEEFARMQRVKEVTAPMGFREPPDEIWEGYWTSTYNRIERGIAWILVSVGATVVLTWGVWKWFEAIWQESDVPLFLRVALIAMAAGFIALAISVIREKVFTHRRDPYKEVQR